MDEIILILFWIVVAYWVVGLMIWGYMQYEEMKNGYIGGVQDSWKVIPLWFPYLLYSLVFRRWMENDNKM